MSKFLLYVAQILNEKYISHQVILEDLPKENDLITIPEGKFFSFIVKEQKLKVISVRKVEKIFSIILENDLNKKIIGVIFLQCED